MTRSVLIIAAMVGVAACAPPPPVARPASEVAAAQPAPAPTPVKPSLPGTTVASLGDVTQAGLWMRTPLVSAPMRGRVRDPGTGRVVTVDLIPIAGPPSAGSRMSLGAYQALGLPLTALPTLRVEAAG